MLKRIIIAIILLLGISLTACHNDDELFPQQQEEPEIAYEEQAEVVELPELLTTEEATAAEPEAEALNLEGNSMGTSGQTPLELFYQVEITDKIKARINGKSYGKDCDVPYEDLRYVQVLYYGFDGVVHSGELIVNKQIAEDIIDIFIELYEAKYPIERMVLVDEYEADDNASMADNNTSAFNYRPVEGTDRLSLHSYGLAIDINPLYNPYVRKQDGKEVVAPGNAAEYADRTLDNPYYIKEGDVCYEAFTKRGFTWGGEWKNSKDYQHFQKKAD